MLVLISCHSSSQNLNENINDKVDSLRSYYPSGELESMVLSKNGIKNGFSFYYYKNGGIEYIAHYKNGYPTDSSMSYHSNGRLGNVVYYDSLGNHTGRYKIWYDNGNLRQLIEPQEIGIEDWQYYYKSGQLRKHYFYKDKKKYGTWKYYTESGEVYKQEIYLNDSLLKDPSEVFMINNKDTVIQKGWKREYYHLGPIINIKSETHYDEGNPNGYSVEYLESGAVKKMFNYKNGLLSGKQFEYYFDNNLKLISEYKKGRKVGEWIYYDEEGNIIKKISY